MHPSPPRFYLLPDVFFSLWTGSRVCVYSEVVMVLAHQAAPSPADRTLRVTEPLFLFIKLATTFTWPPEALHLHPWAPLPHWWLKKRLANLTRNIPGSGTLMRHNQARGLDCASEAAMEQERGLFLASSVSLGTPAQPESVLPADSAMLVEVGGSLVFTGKHKKQRKVPKCLMQKEALFPGVRVYCKARLGIWNAMNFAEQHFCLAS